MILHDLIKISDIPTKVEKADAIDAVISKGCGNIIKMIFDDMIKFNVAVVRLPELRYRRTDQSEPTNEDLEQLLTKLANRQLTGNHALSACTNFGNRLDNDAFDMFCDILQSNPRLGINTTDLNKRCELLKIPQFKVHLCQRLEKARSKINYRAEWVVQPKIDGNRIASIKEIITKQYSRKGHERDTMDHIVAILNKYPTSCVFDGETEYRDSLEATGAIRRKGVQAREAIYTLFGIYDLQQWKTEQHTDPYELCYNRARDFVESLSDDDKRFVRVVPSFRIGSFNCIEDWEDAVSGYYEHFLEEGYEGIVAKTLHHVYLPSSGSKRSIDTIKNKPWVDKDVTVIGFNESDKNPNTLGSFQCIDDEGVKCDCAPGNIKKDELDYIWTHPHLFLHKTLEIKHQKHTVYGNYRHPNAVKFREDV